MSFILSSEQRSGLLVAVISGNRPTLKERHTARFLAPLRDAGFENVVWIVNDQDAQYYEPDTYPFAIYTRDWAYDYARTHWLLPTPPQPDGFFGAFPGREYGCREAERRNCWGVLQLDDNINELRVGRAAGAGCETARTLGGLSWFADVLGACTLATNGCMVGCSMTQTANSELIVARTGFPYSLFVEQVGEGREEWYGPFEDDIIHAYQYGARADSITSVVMPLIRYEKEAASKTGMRANYNHARSVQLQRLFPETSKLVIRRTKSNGRGDARVFHQMLSGAIRNKLTVQDPDMYRQVKTAVEQALILYGELSQKWVRHKVMTRAVNA